MRVNWTAMGISCLLLWCATSETLHAANSQEEPSSEFLEFLGRWETDDGQWIDPMELLDPSWEIRTPTIEDGEKNAHTFWPFGDESDPQEEQAPTPEGGRDHD